MKNKLLVAACIVALGTVIGMALAAPPAHAREADVGVNVALQSDTLALGALAHSAAVAPIFAQQDASKSTTYSVKTFAAAKFNVDTATTTAPLAATSHSALGALAHSAAINAITADTDNCAPKKTGGVASGAELGFGLVGS